MRCYYSSFIPSSLLAWINEINDFLCFIGVAWSKLCTALSINGINQDYIIWKEYDLPWQADIGSPSVPAGQAQRKVPSIFVHKAERPQGLRRHSSTSLHPSSGFPSYPSGHSHLCAPGKFTHNAPCPQAPS